MAFRSKVHGEGDVAEPAPGTERTATTTSSRRRAPREGSWGVRGAGLAESALQRGGDKRRVRSSGPPLILSREECPPRPFRRPRVSGDVIFFMGHRRLQGQSSSMAQAA